MNKAEELNLQKLERLEDKHKTYEADIHRHFEPLKLAQLAMQFYRTTDLVQFEKALKKLPSHQEDAILAFAGTSIMADSWLPMLMTYHAWYLRLHVYEHGLEVPIEQLDSMLPITAEDLKEAETKGDTELLNYVLRRIKRHYFERSNAVRTGTGIFTELFKSLGAKSTAHV